MPKQVDPEVVAYNEAEKIGDLIVKRRKKMNLETYSLFLQEIGDMVRKMDEALEPEDDHASDN